MTASAPTTPRSSSDLLVEIIETLEACGLDRDDYQLQDWVDVEALEQLLATSQEDISVRFTVRDVQLLATPNEVQVLVESGSASEQA
ncbi:HalOD1 output domain-containing protein [Halobaculum sp. EA56]|uniref:HalOD1 output domain-containing protein n=1 Tax=Halobaculum sp. EA56 TaxID=3421648 RepID=UPI003EB72127